MQTNREDKARSDAGRLLAKRRAETLTAERRTEIARNAALARWGNRRAKKKRVK